MRQLPVRARVHDFATKPNNSIEQPSRNTRPCRCRPRIRRSCRAPSPIFAASFPSDIFRTHTVPFDDVVPSIVPSLDASAASTDESRIVGSSFASVGQVGRAPRLEVHFVRAGDQDRGSGCARRRRAVVRIAVAEGDRSAIKSPPRILTSLSLEASTNLVPSGRKRARSMGLFSPGRIV
jgi:hypothetical protein